MEYAKHYWALIERARNRRPLVRCYYERHHILPKCMGGGNEAENLVRLTPEEHYLAHRLLAKMYPDNPKLAYACVSMSRRAGRRSGGSVAKRYAIGAQKARGDFLAKWRRKYTHRTKRAKRYRQSHVEMMRKILTPAKKIS